MINACSGEIAAPRIAQYISAAIDLARSQPYVDPSQGACPSSSAPYGIVIRMYADDHPPPHFRTQYAEFSAIIGIADLSVIEGKLTSRALGLVVEWASLHQGELHEAWRRCSDGESPDKIEPLG